MKVLGQRTGIPIFVGDAPRSSSRWGLAMFHVVHRAQLTREVTCSAYVPRENSEKDVKPTTRSTVSAAIGRQRFGKDIQRWWRFVSRSEPLRNPISNVTVNFTIEVACPADTPSENIAKE